MDYSTYYQSITKPFFAPPEWVFGFAWSIIYPLIALALVLTIYYVYKRRMPQYLLGIFIVNMVANVLFTPIQLGLQNNILATLDILIVLGTLLYFEYKVFRFSKFVFFLMLPYLLWGAYATALQLSILFLN